MRLVCLDKDPHSILKLEEYNYFELVRNLWNLSGSGRSMGLTIHVWIWIWISLASTFIGGPICCFWDYFEYNFHSYGFVRLKCLLAICRLVSLGLQLKSTRLLLKMHHLIYLFQTYKVIVICKPLISVSIFLRILELSSVFLHVIGSMSCF